MMEFMVWTGMGWEGGYNGVCDIHLAMVSFLFLFVSVFHFLPHPFSTCIRYEGISRRHDI